MELAIWKQTAVCCAHSTMYEGFPSDDCGQVLISPLLRKWPLSYSFFSVAWGHFPPSLSGRSPVNCLSECMVRRRVASAKRTMAVGLRQCIRPLVESLTPGHDGYPLALVPIMWTVW